MELHPQQSHPCSPFLLSGCGPFSFYSSASYFLQAAGLHRGLQMRILSPEAVVLKDRGGGSFPLSSYLPVGRQYLQTCLVVIAGIRLCMLNRFSFI